MRKLWFKLKHRLTPEPLNKEQLEARQRLILVLENVIDETISQLRSFRDSRGPHEGIVYWAGLASNDQWVITTCITPKARTTAGSFSTSARANAEVIAVVNRHKLQLFAQVHSHPGSWVAHSEGDNAMAFMPYEGYLSIIVPQYGQRGMTPLTMCGVHQYRYGCFWRLCDDDVKRQFCIVPERADLRKKQAYAH